MHQNSKQMSRIVTKPTKWHVGQAKTQISLGIRPVWSESSLSAWRKLGSLATHWAHSEEPDQTGRMPWSDWVDAQADLSLLWAHMPFRWFYHDAAHINQDSILSWNKMSTKQQDQHWNAGQQKSNSWTPVGPTKDRASSPSQLNWKLLGRSLQ